MSSAQIDAVDLDACLSVALEAAQKAGQVIRDAWHKPRHVHHKSEHGGYLGLRGVESGLYMSRCIGHEHDHDFLD